MAGAIEQLKQAMEVCELGALTLPDQIDALMDAARAISQEVSTLTQPTIGHCKDCDNWDEEFSAGRKSLNNYVCFCSEWSDPEIGYERYTRPDDYCSYFEPKEGMEDGKND
ncbi:MAG: hypothetical protein ACLR6W_00400 [Evtepia sp.]